jgi:predicted HAD superfamily hydrolase
MNNSLARTIDFPNLDNYKLISFDIFDTAVFRMVFEPRDVFLLMEEELVEKYGKTFLGFSDLRFKAELETIEKVWRVDRAAEVNLDDIYSTLFFLNPVLKQFYQELKATELRTELSLIVPSSQVLDYFNKARQLQKNIIFVSDTYLPKEHITKMLETSGYKGYDKLFVSCEVGTNKVSGKLFDVVINDMNVEPKYILHIGDNEYADIKQPATRGINIYQLPYPASLLNHSRYYSEKYKTYNFRETSSESLFRGLQKNYLMNRSKTKSSKLSSSYDIGYQILGPLCYGFISWIIQHAEERNIKHLYFIAREGWFLKNVFDEINLFAKTGIISHYFYASRRALFFPFISRPISEFLLSFLVSTKPTKLSKYLNALELEIDDKRLRELGFTSKEDIINPESNQQDRSRLKALFDSETEQLERLANEEKLNYLEYLQQLGMLSTNQIGLVDSGWFGNGQKKLQKIIELSNPEAGIFGFYLALHAEGKGNFDEKSLGYGYLYHFDNFNDDVESFLEIARILEVFLSAPAESLKKFSKKDGVLSPIFMKENKNPKLHPIIEEIHEGGLDFVRDFVKLPTQRIPKLHNYLTRNLLEKFIESPTQEEAFNIGTLPYDANALAADSQPRFAFPEINLAIFFRNPLRLDKEF